MANANCPICNSLAILFDSTGDYEHYRCPKCNEFKISDTDLQILRNNPLKDDERDRVSQAIKGLPRENGIAKIPPFFIEDIRNKHQ